MHARILAVALVAAAGSTAVIAAPRESADLVAVNGGPIGSKDLPGSANNTIVSVTFNGSDGGGAYNATYLNMSGTIGQTFGASYFREAVVKVTPPGGTPFYAQLINIGASGTGAPVSGTVAVVPVSNFTTAGTWTFEFADYYNDVTTGDFIDARWDAFTVSLDDGPLPAPAIGPGAHLTSTLLTADGALNAGTNGIVDWNNADASAYNGLRLSGIVTMGDANPAADLNANTTPDLRIQVTAPSGAVLQVAPVAGNGLSSIPFDITIAPSGPTVGNWNFRLYDAADLAAVTDLYVPVFTAELVNVPAPTPTIPVTLVNGTTVTDTQAYTASLVRWYTFSVPADVTFFTNRALEIDTEGSAAANPSICLYDHNGARVVADFDDGSGTQAQLSFGADSRPAIGTSVAFNGRDGALLATGNPYYLAVMSSNGTYGPALWSLTPGAGAAANVSVNFRYFDPGIPPATPPSPVTDLGIVGGDVVATATFTTTDAPDVVWVKFTTTGDVTAAGTTYVDIDTEGTALTGTGTNPNDTEIGLYTSFGGKVAEDDDDGSGAMSQLTFGNTANPRAAFGDGLAYNGRDGASLPAGTYYVAAGAYNKTFNAGFNVTHTASAITTGANGQLLVNVRSNLPVAPPACSPADVGTAGGVAGHDRLLNNNDFIAFITLFFNQDPQADLGMAGGQPGHDNAWDNNDFIAFINYFFNDQANCTG